MKLLKMNKEFRIESFHDVRIRIADFCADSWKILETLKTYGIREVKYRVIILKFNNYAL